MEKINPIYEHWNPCLPKKGKRVICEDPATCPFCKAGIERKVQFQIYDEVDKVMRAITMPEKVYNDL